MELLDENAPAPRLCHVVRWPDFEGYGFNLHSDKGRQAQMIGKVDPDSPAELAGLLKGDRIIEVNGINITNENHKQVVERIKAVPDETRLLVIDPKADAWYQDNKVVLRGTQKNVIYLQNPPTRDGVVDNGFANKNDSPRLFREPLIERQFINRQDESPEHHRKISQPESPVLRRKSLTTSNKSDREDEPKKPARKSSITSAQSEVDIHPIPRQASIDNNSSSSSEPNAKPDSLFAEVKQRSLSDARREFFRQQQHPEEHQVDHTVLGFSPDYSHAFDGTHQPTMLEQLHEKVTVNKDHTADELASQLVGFRAKDEEHEREENKHVHFSRSAIFNGNERDAPQIPPMENGHGKAVSPTDFIEVHQESVTHSPVFDTQRDEQEEKRESVYEKTEVRRHHEAPAPRRSVLMEVETKNKDSGNEDSRSNSNSLSNSDSSDEHNVNTRQGTYDVTLSDDARTPSPSPAVIPIASPKFTSEIPSTSATKTADPKPMEEKPKPPIKTKVETNQPTSSSSAYNDMPALRMTAQQMRAQLAEKTRAREDPRKKTMDLRKKYEMINNM